MNPNEQQAVFLTRENWLTINNNFDALLAECNQQPEPQQSTLKRQLGEAYGESLKNYIEAENRILNEPQQRVQDLIKTAGDAQKEIETALKNLQDIKDKLNSLTKAIKQVATVVATLS